MPVQWHRGNLCECDQPIWVLILGRNLGSACVIGDVRDEASRPDYAFIVVVVDRRGDGPFCGQQHCILHIRGAESVLYRIYDEDD